MSKARIAFITFLPRVSMVLVGAAALWLGKPEMALAREALDGATSTEGWAWSQIKRGGVADFNQRCGTLDPKEENDKRWKDGCRNISSHFVVRLLTHEAWRDAVPFEGVRITGARITGDIDLGDAKLIRPIEVVSSRFEGAITLEHARTDSLISFDGSLINAEVDADGLHSESDLILSNGTFEDEVQLYGAKIDGDVKMDGATFENEVGLTGASITGEVDMAGASFGDKLDATSLQVSGNVHMASGGQNKATSFKEVVLERAKIAGPLVDMSGVNFAGRLYASSIQTGQHMSLRNAQCTDAIDLTFAHIGANLDLRGTTLAGRIDLSGASITGELQLADPKPVWSGDNGDPGDLYLRNTHVGYLVDAEDAWPAKWRVHLSGFTFNRLSSSKEDTKPEVRHGGIRWWDEWARRDDYSPALYEQLAAVFTNMGARNDADEIRFYGRKRERENERWLAWIWSGALQYVAGFGIGTYTFRVLIWVLVISFVSGLYLRTCVKGVHEEKHGFVWCFGASLSRLLPVIEINKEFTEFFNDPERKRLTGPQCFFFSVISIVGFVLGAVLVAAISGLTKGS